MAVEKKTPLWNLANIVFSSHLVLVLVLSVCLLELAENGLPQTCGKGLTAER